MSAPVVEQQESRDDDLFLPAKTAVENERDDNASVETTSSVDRRQAQFGNAAVASLPDPRPMAWVHRGLGNSTISRLVRRSLAAAKTPQEKGKAKSTGQAKEQDGSSHGPKQRRQREEASEGLDLESPNTGQSVASENAATQDTSALGQTAATSNVIGSGATAESVFQNFATASATQIATRIGGTGERLRQQFQQDRDTFVESSPSLRVAIAVNVAGQRRATNAGPAAVSKLPTAESIVLGAASPETPLPADETTVKPQPGNNQLQTDAGATPVFRADGEATPDRMKPAATAASSTAHQAGAQILTEINGNTASDRMVVAPVDCAGTIDLPQTTAVPVAEPSGEMLEYLYTDVGSDVRAIADSDFAPILEQTLAGPRDQVEKAAAERDANRETAYIEAQAEADAASTEAEKQQHSAIADGKSAVEAEKQIGLKDQQTLLNNFDTDAKEKYQSQNQEIDALVKEEQEKADQEIIDGNAKAKKLADDAKKEEARERAEREKSKPKKKKKKWYQKVSSWFKKTIRKWTDALVSAVKTVFDKAKKLVTDALATAKRVAVGIIKKLRDKVVGLIKTFAAGLKVLVNVLLVAFPKLRDKVNAAIDTVVEKAIEVVDAIAKKLEDTVVALIDRVQSVVTKIMDLCELVIVTQLQIAGALLTGEFLQAAKILFLAACKAVGIPGEEFLSILSDARDAFMDIIKHPARFLKSLIKSIGQGMGNFISGFRGHFVGGITGWLFGAVAEGGISLPKTFSLKSIFSLLLQVLGFTYDYIRSVAVRVVGERNVAIVEDVMLKVKTLFTDGPGMIWDWIKDKAREIKQKIIDSVSEWLITQLIMKAATKLATMFTPVGAFVQAVLMMYNTIMFFIERIKQIFAWVKSITGSFTRMSKGMVSAAAAWIEQAMAKAIPLIIAFLARLVGLGGIGAKVKGVVTKIRQPIDKAIVFVIEKLVAIGQKVWGGLKATRKTITNWWNTRSHFRTADGHQHTFYLDPETPTRLMMASEKGRPASTILDATAKNATGRSKEQIGEVRREVAKTEALTKKASNAGPNAKETKSIENQIKSTATKASGLEIDLPQKTGGTHGDLISIWGGKLKKNGKEINHVPAWDTYAAAGIDVSVSDGYAIVMDTKDHRGKGATHETFANSTGSSDHAKGWRSMQTELLEAGNWKDAIDMEIAEYQTKFGQKYDAALSQMLDSAIADGRYNNAQPSQLPRGVQPDRARNGKETKTDGDSDRKSRARFEKAESSVVKVRSTSKLLRYGKFLTNTLAILEGVDGIVAAIEAHGMAMSGLAGGGLLLKKEVEEAKQLAGEMKKLVRGYEEYSQTMNSLDYHFSMAAAHPTTARDAAEEAVAIIKRLEELWADLFARSGRIQDALQEIKAKLDFIRENPSIPGDTIGVTSIGTIRGQLTILQFDLYKIRGRLDDSDRNIQKIKKSIDVDIDFLETWRSTLMNQVHRPNKPSS